MSNVFVVKNQQGLFANKHKEWADGREPKLLFRSPHKDEAINLVFELSSRDIYLRAEAISVELGENKQPIVEVTAELPPTEEAEEQASEQPEEEPTDNSNDAENAAAADAATDEQADLLPE